MKKVISLLLVACMAFGLVACGGNDTKPTETKPAAAATEATAEKPTEAPTET